MAFRRLPVLLGALLFVDFFDEFSAGMPMVGAPGLQQAFTLSYTTVAFWIFTAPMCVSWLLEPPLFVLADRHSKKLFVCGGLLAMGIFDLVVGLSGTWIVIAGALALCGVASGCGVSLSQATLMDASQGDHEQIMTRWVFMGALGDVAAPALFWLLGVFALGWREAFQISGVLLILYAVFLARLPFPQRVTASEEAAKEPQPSIFEGLRMAFANRRLLLWLLAAWLCGLLDELLIAFGALQMREVLGADGQTRSLILMCFTVGALLGVAVLQRLLRRFEPRPLLLVAAFGGALTYAGWLFADTAISSGAWMACLGLFVSAQYPLAKAQAYRELPGSSATVNALSHIFTPLDIFMPLVLGLIADRFGIFWALGLLIAQPIGLMLIAFSGYSPSEQGRT